MEGRTSILKSAVEGRNKKMAQSGQVSEAKGISDFQHFVGESKANSEVFMAPVVHGFWASPPASLPASPYDALCLVPCSSLFICGKTLRYSQAVLYNLSSIVSRLKTVQSPPLWLSDEGEHDGLIHLLSDDGEYDGLICPAPAPRTQPVNQGFPGDSARKLHSER